MDIIMDRSAGSALSSHGDAPLFSIIMPSYGVARYIGAALDDIQAQTVGDWELVVVDDGSADNASEIVTSRMHDDSRIRLVRHDSNRGLSAARNTGLKYARGRYVWIPDPDDRYDATLLEHALDALESTCSDIAVFGCVEEYFDQDGRCANSRSILPPVSGTKEDEALHRCVLDLEESTLYGYAWNKVYKRSLLTDLSFESVPLIEDILFNVQVFQRVSRCAFLCEAPYRYAKRLSANLTNKFVPRYYEVHRRRIQALYDQQVCWGLDGDDVRSRLGSLYGRFIMSALERNCDPQSKMTHADRVAWCERLFEDPLFESLVSRAQSRGGRVLSLGLLVLKSRSAGACCALGRLIHLVRGSGSQAYARLKMQR